MTRARLLGWLRDLVKARADAVARAEEWDDDAVRPPHGLLAFEPNLGPYRRPPSRSRSDDSLIEHHLVALLAQRFERSTYLAFRLKRGCIAGLSAVEHTPAEVHAVGFASGDASFQARALAEVAEARAAMGAKPPPALCEVHDAGFQSPRWSAEADVPFPNGFDGLFVAYEYAHGTSLARLVHATVSRGLEIPSAIAGRIVFDAASALAAVPKLASRGPELTPSMIRITFAGRVRMSGLAKQRSFVCPTAIYPVPRSGVYQPPERLRGGETSEPALVFTLGALFFEMLTGRAPFGERSDIETLARIARGQVEAAHVRGGAACGPELERVARAAIAPDAATRPPTLAAFCGAIERAIGAEELRLAGIALRRLVRVVFANEIEARERLLRLVLHRG